MVSVDGGPTREALDSVFTLLKENVQCEDEDELMDNDEVTTTRTLATCPHLLFNFQLCYY